jgi:RNA binding exosome subunit
LLVDHITLKIFASFDENPEEISRNLVKMMPFDLKQEGLSLRRKTVMGFNQEKIVIFELTLKKKAHISVFLDHFKDNLSINSKNQLLNTLEERMDDESNFYIRLSKPSLINYDTYELTSDGICLHITIHVATFPRRRENALQEIKTYLTSEI